MRHVISIFYAIAIIFLKNHSLCDVCTTYYIKPPMNLVVAYFSQQTEQCHIKETLTSTEARFLINKVQSTLLNYKHSYHATLTNLRQALLLSEKIM